jgi:hypothetical protein
MDTRDTFGFFLRKCVAYVVWKRPRGPVKVEKNCKVQKYPTPPSSPYPPPRTAVFLVQLTSTLSLFFQVSCSGGSSSSSNNNSRVPASLAKVRKTHCWKNNKQISRTGVIWSRDNCVCFQIVQNRSKYLFQEGCPFGTSILYIYIYKSNLDRPPSSAV